VVASTAALGLAGVLALALTFLAFTAAFFEACFARAMAPGAGVFLATSAQSRFFFTDNFGVFFGSATVALFLTDCTRALEGVARGGGAGVLAFLAVAGVLALEVSGAVDLAVAGVLALVTAGVLASTGLFLADLGVFLGVGVFFGDALGLLAGVLALGFAALTRGGSFTGDEAFFGVLSDAGVATFAGVFLDDLGVLLAAFFADLGVIFKLFTGVFAFGVFDLTGDGSFAGDEALLRVFLLPGVSDLTALFLADVGVFFGLAVFI